MPVRWALEEVGQPYDVRLLSFSAMKEPEHLALHPFGQIPTYQDGDLALFESGAIVLHIAERHAGLLPADANSRARAAAWMFAALATVEPPIVDRGMATLLEHDRPWYWERLPVLESRVRVRLSELSRRLGGGDWLDGGFSAGDLMMVTVLRRLHGLSILEGFPNLSTYVARGEARPAYRRAFEDQAAVSNPHRPAHSTEADLVADKRMRSAGEVAARGVASASQSIDVRIAALPGWRGETLTRIRTLIREADPQVIEEVKWQKPSNPSGVPVWSHAGILCTGETYKDKVKLTFAKGASLGDPSGLFNSSLEGGTRRAIDLRDGDRIDETAFKAFIRAAVAMNTSGR